MPIYYRGKQVIHIIVITATVYRDKAASSFRYAYSYKYKNKTYFNTDEMLVKFIYKDNSTSKEVTSLGLVNESKTYDVAVCTNKKDLNLYLNANTPATNDGTEDIIPEIILKGVRSWNAQFKSLVDNKCYNYIKIPKDKLNDYNATFDNAKFLATIVNKPSTTDPEESTYSKIGIGISPLTISPDRAFGFNQFNKNGYWVNQIIYNKDGEVVVKNPVSENHIVIDAPTTLTNYDVLIPIIYEDSHTNSYSHLSDLVISTARVINVNCNVFMGIRLGVIYKGDGTKPYDFYKADNIEWYDINFNKLEGRDYNIDNMIYLKNATTQTVIERFRLKQKFSYWFYYNVVGLVLNPYFIIQPIQGSKHTMAVRLTFETDYNNYSNIFEFEY